jgi:hypothetical protein
MPYCSFYVFRCSWVDLSFFHVLLKHHFNILVLWNLKGPVSPHKILFTYILGMNPNYPTMQPKRIDTNPWTIQSHTSPAAYTTRVPPMDLSADFEPNDYTVLCGKGKECYYNVGNKRFRALANMYLERYSHCNAKSEKSAIVSAIIGHIRKNEGAFAKLEDGKWYDVGDAAAREKVGAFFRDRLHARYRSATKSKTVLRRERKKKKNKQQPSNQSSDDDYSSVTTDQSGQSSFSAMKMEMERDSSYSYDYNSETSNSGGLGDAIETQEQAFPFIDLGGTFLPRADDSQYVDVASYWNSPVVRNSLDARIAMLPPTIASLLEPTPLPPPPFAAAMEQTNEPNERLLHENNVDQKLPNRPPAHARSQTNNAGSPDGSPDGMSIMCKQGEPTVFDLLLGPKGLGSLRMENLASDDSSEFSMDPSAPLLFELEPDYWTNSRG